MIKFLISLTILFLAALSPASATEGWEAMKRPGAIALMRHAHAPGTGDPAGFRLDDCATQRNLNHEGRDQARAIGAAFRANGIEIDRVLTSQWCRSRETAELLDLGPVEELPALNSFFDARDRRDRQTEDTLVFLRDQPRDQRMVLVSHQVNVRALTGRGTGSGAFVIVQVAPDGRLEVLGEVHIGY